MFKDRFDAGNQLVSPLMEYHHQGNILILAIPRGGVEVGYVLSQELQVPLDVILTEKITYPGKPECTIGVASLENVILDKQWTEISGDFNASIKHEIQEIRLALNLRAQAYRGDKKPVHIKDAIVILVTDGITTGKTVETAVELLKKQGPQKIIVAVPVIAKDALRLLKNKVEEIVYLIAPDDFRSVGQCYKHFDEVDEAHAIALLQEAHY